MRVGFVGWRGMVGSVLMQRTREENDFDNIENWDVSLVTDMNKLFSGDIFLSMQIQGKSLFGRGMEFPL